MKNSNAKKRSVLKVALMTALALTGALAPSAAQAAEVAFTVSHQQLKDQIEDTMESYRLGQIPGAQKPDCNLYWAGTHVSVARRDSDSINATIHMKCSVDNFADPDVYIHMAIGFGCHFANPSIKVAALSASVSVDWPWYVDVLSLSATWWAGNISSRVATSKLVVAGALTSFGTTIPVSTAFCPKFNVLSNADIQILTGPGTQCTNGVTKHSSCPSNYEGAGKTEKCINGYWETTIYDCDPKAPPGGQVP
jgi:hypothetical protein